MIFDNIKNCEMYYGVNPKFKKAFEFIEKAVKENLETGKYEISGKEIYASIQSYDSKLKDNAKFEGHKNYIDIQYIVEGREMMGTLEISKAVIKGEYNPEKDVMFYEDSEIASYCITEQGDFCIFYPHDIHCPGVSLNNMPSGVKKIVVKVHI